jgi:mono/diheme cytochrome c family protein
MEDARADWLSLPCYLAMLILRIFRRQILIVAGVMVAVSVAGVAFHRWRTRPAPGRTIDEARMAGRSGFPPPVEDYFHAIDGAADLGLEEIQGRNAWMVWSAGNDRFWDWMARESGGTFDLLKIVAAYDPGKDPRLTPAQRERLREAYRFRRSNRGQYLGVTNEPCYSEAAGPDQRHFDLWMDQRDVACPGDPFADPEKYPGVPLGARGRNMPLGSAYGEPSGVLGLRLFPNPEFRGEAVMRWDAARYYTDPDYYSSPNLVRPYRVGVTCAFCHAGLNPARWPEDPEDPQWGNISSTAGARGLRVERIAMWQADPADFVWQALAAARPGALDTSLVATDSILNPRGIRGVFQVRMRMEQARRWGKEVLAGASLGSRQMSQYVAGGPLAAFFDEPSTVWTPRFGKSAMDSVGVLAAVNRYFPELGAFSEEMLLHHAPLTGGKPQLPMEPAAARRGSAYWKASEDLSADIVRFLMKVEAPPAAPGTLDRTAAARGRLVFADRCAACHSSKSPAPPKDAAPGACSGNYLDCWNRYWNWTHGDEYRREMRRIAAAADFTEQNYFSTELRVPLPLVGTNACIALSGNGMAGRLWSGFTSATYQHLPSAGAITYYHPETGERREMRLPAGGPGYLRPPSLAGLWTVGGYLNDNSLGKPSGDLSPAARKAAFREGMEQLLWPERRQKDDVHPDLLPGRIARTTAVSRLHIAPRFMPEELERGLGLRSIFGLGKRRSFEIGPIPAGTPVGLLASLDVNSPRALTLLERMRFELRSERDFAKFVDALLEVSACPDLVENRGHYFGTGRDGEPALSDQQKTDLIEFLLTL